MSVRAIASRKLEIGAFLQSWGPLKQKLEEQYECEKQFINQLTASSVNGSNLEKLNEHIHQRKAIERVFQLVQELKEDLYPDEVSSDEE